LFRVKQLNDIEYFSSALLRIFNYISLPEFVYLFA
jgi:hypothetical protein